MQIQPFYEVDTSLYRPKRCISTEDVVRGRYTSLCIYATCIDWIERLYFFILLIDNFTVTWFVQCPSHIFYIINCHAKHETEDQQMDIHPGLGVLATGN
jgi:hypothetical protein